MKDRDRYILDFQHSSHDLFLFFIYNVQEGANLNLVALSDIDFPHNHVVESDGGHMSMDIKVKVSFDGQPMDILSAIKNSLIVVSENRLIPQGNVKISISTLLLDQDGSEIFENDLVQDSNGKKFQIIYKNGAFFAAKIDSIAHDPLLPLYLLQLNGNIPVKKCYE